MPLVQSLQRLKRRVKPNINPAQFLSHVDVIVGKIRHLYVWLKLVSKTELLD